MPSIENSGSLAVALMVIVPLFEPQSSGSIISSELICGAAGATRLSISVSWQFIVPTTLTMRSKSPAGRSRNILLSCQVFPPSMEYSRFVPVAIIVITPSLNPQSVGSTVTISSIIGGVGCRIVPDEAAVQLVELASRTIGVYEPPASVLKTLLDCQLIPSIEYSSAPAPDAMIVMEPSSIPQSEASVVIISSMMGAAGADNTALS